MYPASFEYHRATSLDEAVALLGKHPDAKLLAGGHTLIPMMKLRLAQPAAVIDVGRIDTLRGISETDGGCRIGALTTHAEIAASELLRACCPLLPEAAAKIGDPAVRNRGTIGGNVAHADPASDLPAVLCALGAAIVLAGPAGSRTVAAPAFFLDLMTTDLGPGEVLVAVEISGGRKGGSAYLKVEHPASGYAVCGAAAILELAAGGTCGRAVLAFNGVAVKPFLASAVTGALAGVLPDDAAIDAAVDAHLTVRQAMSDVYASGEYRTHLAKVYGKRALKMARDRVA